MPRSDCHPTRATWGARCGKSARRVLRGGTGTSDLVARLVPTHHLDDGKARDIAKQVGKAVSKWREEAARHGLNKAEMDHMASAFEHADLRAAQRGGSAKV